MGVSDFFSLTRTGQGQWNVLHQITGEFAGTIHRSGSDFVLHDGHRLVGEYATIELALGSLYEVAGS